MKKTMFITSVIMVVVMAIALTTSSLAWFTAAGATEVTTSSLTLQAKTNSSEGLLLCNDHSSFSTTAILPATASGSMTVTTGTVSNMQPVAPYGDSVLDALAKTQFTGSYVSNATGTNLWATDSAYTDHYAGYVYVANGGDANENIAVAINFDNVDGATLYVAVLAKKTQDNYDDIATSNVSDWEIVRVSSSNGSTTVNSLTSLPISAAAFAQGGAVASAVTSTSFTPCTSNTSTTSVSARESGDVAYSHWQQFLIVAWYSADLTNYNSGATNTYGSFTVTFSI